ncbi:hypothetical protein CAPTEDRAFT_199363 [Capitella teleta]|uniref:Uncharacterized protein n=1 Tax=Capitella teleta TaxID=283909 RepID=R7UYL4_CAPTE|nr:hypothetical protein CAPTEDRAFT_203213 [Capitella teleta]ELU09022.1 hypothetical protein CAPTEDRAFT_199363 [Capitella teleta]|eukprot:ELT96849.1 hypothetical protein CAPTEDRAFT_203213 [Capitella teleta]
MNSIPVAILFACCVALSTASYDQTYYQPGFNRGPHGIAAVYRNDLRQVAVNHRAEAVGASDGTADFYGVPGAGKYVFDNRYPSNQGYRSPRHQGYGSAFNNYAPVAHNYW